MDNKLHQALIAAAVLALCTASASAAGNCYPAKGKIFSNAQPGGSTLGVVALVLGTEKTKCAVLGIPQISANPTFHHTIVCESAAASNEAQDQITFLSTVQNTAVTEACTGDAPPIPAAFSFKETATVIAGTGRGAFTGVEEGNISITGDINCSGGVRMQFEGQVCFPN